MAESKLRILFASSEVDPFSKTGGLADVSRALPAALSRLGHDVAVFTPYYGQAKKSAGDIRFSDAKITIQLRGRIQEARIGLGRMPDSGVEVYFIANDSYYDREGLYQSAQGDYLDNAERFTFFCRACLETIKALRLKADLIHANDWQSALLPVYVKTLYSQDERIAPISSVLGIHNLAYQGIFWHWDMPLTGLDWKHFNWKELEFYGKLNLLKGGIVYADALTTVSRTYAKEIQTPEGGNGLDSVIATRKDGLYGIANGIDDTVWNPMTDKFIARNFSALDQTGKSACKQHLQKKMGLPQRAETPVIGMIGRLANQKGWDIFAEAVQRILNADCQLAVLGTGEERYEKMLRDLAAAKSDKVSVRLSFDDQLAHEIEAGADMFLMPSRFEPCGLGQLYALSYGAVPIVRKTGGLADTVRNVTPHGLKSGSSTGFVFTDYSAEALYDAVRRALELFKDRAAWKTLMTAGMEQDWSWDKSAKEYTAVYRTAIAARKQAYGN
jgi:starch synthase